MPYDRNSELPSEVKDKYKTRRQQTAFRKAFNAAMDEYHDESKAFAVAHKAAQSFNANEMISSIYFEADAANPRILHFKDYVLARPEVNKNKDSVDARGIQELAETIAGMPIDLNHDSTKNVGFFTAGRVGVEGELRTDGSIWLDRCEENGVDPQDVYDTETGRSKLGMSIEADAASAECSICKSSFQSESQYCDHIRVQGNDGGLRSKLKHGATRVMRGLRALGGAFTFRPAGTDTGADSRSRIIFAANQLEVEMSNPELSVSEIAELWVNQLSAAISKREDVSDADKQRAEKEYGDVEYADEKNKKYPLDKEHIHAAWSYINMPKNAAKYSPEELATIKGRIKRAAKKYGMEIAEDKKKNEEKASNMDDEKKEAKETPEEEKKETPAEQKKEKEEGVEKDMKAEYDAMKACLDDMTAQYEAAKTEKAKVESELQSAKTQLAEASAKLTAAEATIKEFKTNELRAKLVGTVLTPEEFEADAESLLAAPARHIELMLKNAKIDKPTSGRLSLAAQESTATAEWTLF